MWNAICVTKCLQQGRTFLDINNLCSSLLAFRFNRCYSMGNAMPKLAFASKTCLLFQNSYRHMHSHILLSTANKNRPFISCATWRKLLGTPHNQLAFVKRCNYSPIQESETSKACDQEHHLQMVTNEMKSTVTNTDEQSSLLLDTELHQKSVLRTVLESEGKILETKAPFPLVSHSLAAYVEISPTLQCLVALQVDLSKLDKHPELASYILKCDFERDICPYVRLLSDIGIDDQDLGTVITKNPQLLQEDMDNIQVRVNYLASKRFSSEAIARIVTKAPQVLTLMTKALDKQLGFIQQEFRLTGNEVRRVVTMLPKICTWNATKLSLIRMVVKDVCGFSEKEVKELLLGQPKIYLIEQKALEGRFDYLHNTMGLSHKTIIQWPDILRTRRHIIELRHRFLQHVNRDQYDPTQENYVSLKALVSGKDRDFCKNVAKVPVVVMNDFLKTV